MGYEYYRTKYGIRSTWEAAIGLQKVDGLEPSKYLYQLMDDNINGKLTFEEVEQLLYSHHSVGTDAGEREADLVSRRILPERQPEQSQGYRNQYCTKGDCLCRICFA